MMKGLPGIGRPSCIHPIRANGLLENSLHNFSKAWDFFHDLCLIQVFCASFVYRVNIEDSKIARLPK